MDWSKEELDSLLDKLKSSYSPEELAKKLGLEKLFDERSCLSDSAILRHISQETIVVHPFVKENLATSSYDVTLGSYFYRETGPGPLRTRIFNPYDEKHVRRIWQLEEAQSARTEAAKLGIDVTDMDKFHDIFGDNIRPEDKVILIGHGDTILAHTDEFIGGRKHVTTMMKARSSWGRNFIEVCKCAGWGDVGYVNRWTMEITNNSQHYTIVLPVGFRIAQIVFFEVEPIAEKDYAVAGGKYQTSDDLSKVMAEWTPEAMLPKMWKDRDVRKRQQGCLKVAYDVQK